MESAATHWCCSLVRRLPVAPCPRDVRVFDCLTRTYCESSVRDCPRTSAARKKTAVPNFCPLSLCTVRFPWSLPATELPLQSFCSLQTFALGKDADAFTHPSTDTSFPFLLRGIEQWRRQKCPWSHEACILELELIPTSEQLPSSTMLVLSCQFAFEVFRLLLRNCLYPWVLNIRDFREETSQISRSLPPPSTSSLKPSISLHLPPLSHPLPTWPWPPQIWLTLPQPCSPTGNCLVHFQWYTRLYLLHSLQPVLRQS